MIANGGKSQLVRLLAAATGEPIVTVRMSDGLIHAAMRGELWCTGVAAPSVGPGDDVITCLTCLVGTAYVDALKPSFGMRRLSEMPTHAGATPPTITPVADAPLVTTPVIAPPSMHRDVTTGIVGRDFAGAADVGEARIGRAVTRRNDA